MTGFSVPEKSKFAGADSILIVDDICDGGGTFIGIAEQLKDYKLPLYLYVTHGIFSKGTAALTEHFDTVFTTDSFYVPTQNPKVIVMPSMPTIEEKINEA